MGANGGQWGEVGHSDAVSGHVPRVFVLFGNTAPRYSYIRKGRLAYRSVTRIQRSDDATSVDSTRATNHRIIRAVLTSTFIFAALG